MNAKISIIDNQALIQLDDKTMSPTDAVLELQALRGEAAEGLARAEAELAEAERENGAALADGEEPDRDLLAAARGNLAHAQKHIKTIESDLSSVQEAIIAHETNRMIDTAIADIERDTETRPDLNEGIARNVAELGLRLAVAQTEHREALGEVDDVRGRVNGISQRISAITRKRLEGGATAGNVTVLLALDYDIRTLREIMDQAKQKAASLDPSDLRAQHQRALGDWNCYIREAMLKALAVVVQSREKELIEALTRLADNAGGAGVQTITDLWRPSDPLHVFVTRTLLSAMPRTGTRAAA